MTGNRWNGNGAGGVIGAGIPFNENGYTPPNHRFPIGKPSPNWHSRPLLPKPASPKMTRIEERELAFEELETSATATKKELMIIFGYIGLAVLLILPTILILVVVRNRQSNDDQKEPDEDNS